MIHGVQRKALHRYIGTCLAGLLTCGTVSLPSMAADQTPDDPASNIYAARLNEPGQETPELSTDELRQILAEGRAIVLDARPRRESGSVIFRAH